MTAVQHLRGQTFHGRKGQVANRFSYGVDYVLIDPEDTEGPTLFSRNKANLTALFDTDHGGAPGHGTGIAWLRAVLAEHGLCEDGPADPVSGRVSAHPYRIALLAQPRVLGHVFNPVSFWLVRDHTDALRVVVAEVTNTFGDRHSYLCHHADHRPILAEDHLTARKILHVSPFQPVEGGYVFRFDIRPDRIGIWIDYTAGNGGLIATLTGPLTPLTNGAIVLACLRRPFGSRRVLTLIHWQALKLWCKGAMFRHRPTPPPQTVSAPSERI